MNAAKRSEHCWSDEILVQIFSKLPHPEMTDGSSNMSISERSVHTLQTNIWSHTRLMLQLRLVCKRFRDIIDQCPQFTACLVISQAIPSVSSRSLIRHLKETGSHVRYFVACCQNQAADLAAGVMLGAATELKKAIILRTSSSIIGILSAFDSLTTCELCTTRRNPVNLAPLDALPNLSTLCLSEGPFHDIHTLSHVSALSLYRAQLEGQHWEFVSNLQHLTLDCSSWSGLEFGLTACTAIQSFKCSLSAVTAPSRAQALDLPTCDQDAQLPENFSTMTQLSELSLAMIHYNASISWVYMLCNLVDLRIMCRRNSDMEIDTQLACLKRLEILVLDLGEQSHLKLKVDWQHIPALRRVLFAARIITVSDGILGLLQLKTLQKLTFGCEMAGLGSKDRSRELLRTLLNNIVVGCPQVQCFLRGEFVSEIQWQLHNVLLCTKQGTKFERITELLL